MDGEMGARKAGVWAGGWVVVWGVGKDVTWAASSASSLDVVWGDGTVSKWVGVWVGVRAASLAVSWAVDWVVQSAN
jgi:hypothetical protein